MLTVLLPENGHSAGLRQLLTPLLPAGSVFRDPDAGLEALTDQRLLFAVALDEAAAQVGVNFIGGFGALMHKGSTRAEETLLEAKKDKEKYRDLIVRVAGYSAYYVTLTERVQDELIQRSEQML